MRHRIGRLHVLTDHRSPVGHVGIVRAAIDGNADSIQLRCKGESTRAVIAAAEQSAALCRRARVPLLVNDRVDVAWFADADGVHLGDEDFPLGSARELLGPGRILGSSADTAEEVAHRVANGADYVGVGPVFATTTKSDTGPVLGLERLASIVRASASNVPLIAIGGISLENVGDVLRTGVHGVAILSVVSTADDPADIVRAFRSQIDAETQRAAPEDERS